MAEPTCSLAPGSPSTGRRPPASCSTTATRWTRRARPASAGRRGASTRNPSQVGLDARLGGNAMNHIEARSTNFVAQVKFTNIILFHTNSKYRLPIGVFALK